MRCQIPALSPHCIRSAWNRDGNDLRLRMILAGSRAKNPDENSKKHVKYLLTGQRVDGPRGGDLPAGDIVKSEPAAGRPRRDSCRCFCADQSAQL
jgi:hypothetical protein